MRRGTLVWLFVALVLIALAAIPAAAKSPPGFAGRWEGLDGDGSTIRYHVKTERASEGNAFRIDGSDTSCISCGGEPALIRGIGLQHVPNELQTAFSAWGLGDSADVLGPFTPTWFYDPGTDTITSSGGNLFHRADQND